MCANYTPTRKERLEIQAGKAASKLPYDWRPESYPGYLAPIIRAADKATNAEQVEFEREVNLASFGLIPSWAKDKKIAWDTYNARLEMVSTKSSFRSAWKKRQLCVIPMENFFEPRYESPTSKSVRWKIEHADGVPLAAAGLWEWRPNGGPEDQPLFSFTILTINADAHPLFKQFHKVGDEKRTIVLLEPHEIDDWLNASHADIPHFLKTFEQDAFLASASPKTVIKKENLIEPQVQLDFSKP